MSMNREHLYTRTNTILDHRVTLWTHICDAIRPNECELEKEETNLLSLSVNVVMLQLYSVENTTKTQHTDPEI